MKITKVTPWLIEAPAPFLDTADDNKNAHLVREYLFVEVSTDEGVTGWGEVTAQSPRALAICAGLRHVSDLIAGDDPRLIEMIWNKIFRSFTYMGSRGATTNMISAIDIALWDIRGKQAGKPVCDLLGDVVRRSVPLYANMDPQTKDETVDRLVERCRERVAEDRIQHGPETRQRGVERVLFHDTGCAIRL